MAARVRVGPGQIHKRETLTLPHEEERQVPGAYSAVLPGPFAGN